MDKGFYTSLPKLELHAHLNGSLSEKTLKTLKAPHESVQDFFKLNKALDLAPSRTLEECFELFKIAHNATSTPAAVCLATENVIKEFAEDGVVYLELRTTPRKEENMTKKQYIEALIKGIENSKFESPQIKVKLILSLDRKQPVEEAEENVTLTKEYRIKYPDIVVGVDVSGDPTKGNWFEDVLIKVRSESDLKITIHCAEIPNKEEVKEILKFKPDRIGHGVFINSETKGSDELWEKFKLQKIPVECCLTSNVKTKTIETYKQHHLKQLIDAEHPFTLCTDDKGVFATSLSEEFSIAAKVFGLTKSDLWKISYNSIDYAFCNNEEKLELKEILTKWFDENLFHETSV